MKLTVCVGSSCHVRGSRSMLARFSEILSEENLEYRVSLVGCFCMDRCGESMSWRFEDEEISSPTAEDAERTLREKLAQALQKQGPGGDSASAEN